MLSGLKLDQLCGQLIVGGYAGKLPTTSLLSQLRHGHRAGAILFRRNIGSLEGAHESCVELAKVALGQAVPPVIAVDEEGGRVSRLSPWVLPVPQALRLAQAPANQIRRVARQLGLELRAIGFNVDFAPVLDINSNPKNPVIGDRSFGADPATVVCKALAFASGLLDAGISCCGKHFPGHGDTSVDSHLELPRVDATIERLNALELVPFAAAIAKSIPCLMSAHVICAAVDDKRPATLSHRWITGMLREQMGFGGVVFSDDLEMRAIADYWTVPQAAVEAIRAGCDIVLVCRDEELQTLAHEALVSEAEVDSEFKQRCHEAAGRSMAWRAKLHSNTSVDLGAVMSVCRSAEATELRELLKQLPSITNA